MGFTDEGSDIYSIALPQMFISSLEVNGIELTVKNDLSLDYNEYHHDGETLTIKVATHPNASFVVLTRLFHFSNAPISLEYDLNTGAITPWEPLIKGSSVFGSEIDTIGQATESIEGSASLSLINDNTFWLKEFDKWTFDNKSVACYSTTRSLEANEAKLLFRGVIQSRQYSATEIRFQLRDELSQLRNNIPLSSIKSLNADNHPENNEAKQRMLFGRVEGHRPCNLQEPDEETGWLLEGTVSISVASDSLTGTGTSFLAWLSPGDEVLLNDEWYSIKTVSSDTSITLDNTFEADANLTDVELRVKFERVPRKLNREWSIAGHALKQFKTTIQKGSTISKLQVASNEGIKANDLIWVGNYPSGSLMRVKRVSTKRFIHLATSLDTIPDEGTEVLLPCVWNVRLNDLLLRVKVSI